MNPTPAPDRYADQSAWPTDEPSPIAEVIPLKGEEPQDATIAPESTNTKGIELIDITDIEEAEPVYLIEGLIEEDTTGAVFGASGSGKSFNTAALAFSITTGVQWIGKTVNRTGPVVYFAQEGRTAFPRRINSLQKHHNIKIAKGLFFLPRCRVEFNEPGARIIADEIAKLQEAPVLIVIDTVARALPAGAEENSSKDMTAFVNAVDSLRDRFGCVICLVHHTGHGADTQGRARGSSSFPAAMDWAILIRNKQLSWPKMKDAEAPKPVSFELTQVGNSAVVEYSESTAHSRPDIRLTPSEKLGQKTLWAVCDALKHYNVPLEDWRKEFYRHHTGDSPASKKQAFHRARRGLIEKKLATVDRDIYSPYVPSVTEVTGVTEGNNDTAVTGERVTERNTGRRPVTAVTHPDSDHNTEGGLFK